MLLTATVDQAIKDRLAEELAELENRFAAELLSELPCVNSLVRHVERYRGKMLRPMLVLVTGMATCGRNQEVTDAHRVVATVAEMVHMATLVHDDILDGADVRRQGATVSHLRGNETAVMLGDYLISHAYHLCSSLPSPLPARIIADATNTVCEGELLQLANREKWDLDEPTYFEIIRRKTASLCGTCCRLGVLLHDRPGDEARKLYDYGEKLGIAFQIVDDVLDLTGDPGTVGKTLGLDLEKGKLTLPLIHCLATCPPGQRRELLALLSKVGARSELTPTDLEQVRVAVNQTDSLSYAHRRAARLVEQAREQLACLPDSSATAMLHQMAQAVLTRKS
jgi:octaprenyl-diphosphate synthase